MTETWSHRTTRRSHHDPALPSACIQGAEACDQGGLLPLGFVPGKQELWTLSLFCQGCPHFFQGLYRGTFLWERRAQGRAQSFTFSASLPLRTRVSPPRSVSISVCFTPCSSSAPLACMGPEFLCLRVFLCLSLSVPFPSLLSINSLEYLSLISLPVPRSLSQHPCLLGSFLSLSLDLSLHLRGPPSFRLVCVLYCPTLVCLLPLSFSKPQLGRPLPPVHSQHPPP